jgi:hypothetical protein
MAGPCCLTGHRVHAVRAALTFDRLTRPGATRLCGVDHLLITLSLAVRLRTDSLRAASAKEAER